MAHDNAIVFLEQIGHLISSQKMLSNANDYTDKFHHRLEDLSKFVDVQFEFKPIPGAEPNANKVMEKLHLEIGGVKVIDTGDIVSKYRSP